MTDLFVRDDLPAAEFSPCRTWRYVLRRRWAPGGAVGFILLNPSTADETQNDPTIRRCIGYAKAWGFGALVLGNLFAYRATDPAVMRVAADPVGPGNNEALRLICREAEGRVICGWGADGVFMDRGKHVATLLRDAGATPQALALTASGQPRHPLYLRADLRPFAL